MKIFLLAMAGMLTAIVLLGVVGYFWVRRKARGFLEVLKELAAGAPPPFRITLERTDTPEWRDAQAIEAATAGFRDAGYQTVGDFEIAEMPDWKLRGFWHAEQWCFVALYDQEQVGVYADVVAFFRDKVAVTVSNGPESGMDRSERGPLVRLAADLSTPKGAHSLHQQMVIESNGRDRLRTVAADFERAFTRSYALEMDWRIERGGVTDDEVRGAAAAGGQEEPSEEQIELVKAQWSSAIAEFIDEQAHEAFLAGSAMTASEWEERRERVLTVHERSDRETLIDTLAWTLITGSYDVDDEEAEERAFQDAKTQLVFLNEGSAREGFARAQALLPEKRRYERIGSVAGRWPADVYAEAESAEP